MKKAIVALMLVICAATLFAATTTQTIILMSVVETKRPSFSLEVANVINGYVKHSTGDEVSIGTLNAQHDVKADLVISQTESRFYGQVELDIIVTELYHEGYHTNGLKLSGNVINMKGREGSLSVCGNSAHIELDYSGCMVEANVAELSVEYNGNPSLPEGEYVSLIVMSYVVK